MPRPQQSKRAGSLAATDREKEDENPDTQAAASSRGESRKRKRQPVRFAPQPAEAKQDSEQEDEEDEEFRPDEDDLDAQEESHAEESEEEESPIRASTAAFMAVGGPMMASLMQEDGPVVSVVILCADGSTEEKKIDMTPKLNSIPGLLGGKATFVGQWRSLDVVLMSLRNPSEETPRNAHQLPPPFQDDVVQGDIVLIRMDENSMPTDFTLAEYNEFTRQSVTDVADCSSSSSSTSTASPKSKRKSKKV